MSTPSPKKRACLTPRNKREADQRQQTSNRVKGFRLGRHLDLNTPEELPGERGKGPTARLACKTREFDENKVDARVKTHWCEDFNVVCEHCNALRWREVLTSFCCQNGKVTLILPLAPPPSALENKKYYDLTQSEKLILPFSRQYNNALALDFIGCNEQYLTQYLEFKASCTTDTVLFFLLLEMIQSLFNSSQQLKFVQNLQTCK